MTAVIKTLKIRINKIINNPFFVILFFYFVAHGLSLFSAGNVYWDDWIIYNHNPDDIIELFDQHGTVWNWDGYLHSYLMHISPSIYTYLSFFVYANCSLLIFLIAKRQKFINDSESLLIGIMFAILPLNLARVACVLFPYAICLNLFLFGWYVFPNNKKKSLILFFISFSINSFLVFYWIIIVENFLKNTIIVNIKSIFKYFVNNLFLFLLPFIFFIINKVYFKPYGFYEGYNEHFAVTNILNASRGFINSLYGINVSLFSVLTLNVIIIFFIGKHTNAEKKIMRVGKYHTYLISILFLAALFPYFILGHYPTFFNWGSRHGLILLIIMPFVIINTLKNYNKKVSNLILATIFSVSFLIDWNVYFDFYKDYRKKEMALKFLSNLNYLEKNSVILFDDKTNSNLWNNPYVYYEWSGMLRKALNRDDLIGISKNDLGFYLDNKFNYSYRALNSFDHIQKYNFQKYYLVNIQKAKGIYLFKIHNVDPKDYID